MENSQKHAGRKAVKSLDESNDPKDRSNIPTDPSKQESAKFAPDKDEFISEEDNMDSKQNVKSEPNDPGSDKIQSQGTNLNDNESRQAWGTNDAGRSQITNSDEDSLSSDWNRRSL